MESMVMVLVRRIHVLEKRWEQPTTPSEVSTAAGKTAVLYQKTVAVLDDTGLACRASFGIFRHSTRRILQPARLLQVACGGSDAYNRS